MKPSSRLLAALALCCAASTSFAQGTIASGSTYLQFVGTPFSTGSGNANLFFGSTGAFGTDELYRYGWAYNQGVGTSNRPFSTLDTPVQSYVGNVATMTWTNAGAGTTGFARWDAVLTITLTEIAPSGSSSQPGQARVDSVLTFTSNAGNSGNINFSVFHELDLDIIGTAASNAANDTYRVLDSSAATGIKGTVFDSTGSNYAEFVGNGATRYEFNTGTSLRTKLGDVSGTGSGSLATAAGTSVADWASTDGAVAFQWTQSLAPGQSVALSTSFTINAPLAPVPEPAGWALLLAGSALLGWRARRRG
jgi:hypothetical protein